MNINASSQTNNTNKPFDIDNLSEHTTLSTSPIIQQIASFLFQLISDLIRYVALACNINNSFNNTNNSHQDKMMLDEVSAPSNKLYTLPPSFPLCLGWFVALKSWINDVIFDVWCVVVMCYVLCYVLCIVLCVMCFVTKHWYSSIQNYFIISN